MPFREEVQVAGGRAVGLVVRLSDRPVKGSAEAERTANKPCAYCRHVIGLNRSFHRISTAGGTDTFVVHADCWKAAPRVL